MSSESRTMTRPWREIVEQYRRLVDDHDLPYRSMLDMVRQIEQSRYAVALFPWTSIHDLCVAQRAVHYPYDGPFLRISPDGADGLEFRYIDTPDTGNQWNRKVAGPDGFARLEQFIDQLHWYSALKF